MQTRYAVIALTASIAMIALADQDEGPQSNLAEHRIEQRASADADLNCVRDKATVAGSKTSNSDADTSDEAESADGIGERKRAGIRKQGKLSNAKTGK